MLRKDNKGFYLSTKLEKFSNLSHSFSTRVFGDMRLKSGSTANRLRFAQELGIDFNRFVYLDQIHDVNIKLAKWSNVGTSIKDTDGLITKERNLFLFARVADCLPMLFYDPIKNAVGICHAGWNGTIGKISSKMVQEFVKNFGTAPKDLLVAFGPSIGPCCYEVKDNVLIKFRAVFGDKSQIIIKRNGKFFIDLRLANLVLLTQNGVKKSNIDYRSVCTSCHNNIFYSYRKEGQDLAGEIAAVVGMGEYRP